MSVVKSAKIEGVWGERTAKIALHRKVNFLIGPNGSGKTTIINLLAAALSSDYDGLARASFSSIECVLTSVASKSDLKVTVRAPAEASIRSGFDYTLKKSGQPDELFTLVSPSPRYYLSPLLQRAGKRSGLMLEGSESLLNKHVTVKWISVHRGPSKKRGEDLPSSESSVDQRLASLANQLVRYFSKLSAQRETETNRFLRQMLNAIVYGAVELDPFASTKNLDLPAIQTSIEALLDTFLEGGTQDVRSRLADHFKVAIEARKEKDLYKLNELVALAAVLPMQKIVAEWKKTQAKQDSLARPRTEFLDTINSMFKNKSVLLNEKNELEVELPGGKRLALSELSSGEKQLLILFAEALLQEKAEFIYIADEPELSLHVLWQEQLTRNLLKINPNAQVIFATHSPDIVSEYGEQSIDMERVIS